MGKLVNVVLPTGRTVSVDEEQAGQLIHGGAQPETVEQANAVGGNTQLAEAYSGTVDKIRAGVEGAADTLTLGGYGKAVDLLGSEDSRFGMQASAREHPGYRAIGEYSAMLAPTGWLGDTAKVISEASPMGLAGKIGEAAEAFSGSPAAGKLVEGAVFGMGGHVASTNVTGDPLTVEGMVESAGVGSLINLGVSAVASRLTNMGRNAADALSETSEVDQHLSNVKAGREVFKQSPDSWNELRDAVEAKSGQAKELYDKAVDADKKFSEWIDPTTGPKKMRGAVDQLERARMDVLERINESPYGKQVKEAAEAYDAQRTQYIKDQKSFETYAGNNEKFTKDLNQMQRLLKKRVVGKDFGDLTPEQEQTFRSYQERISRVLKMKAGGRDIELGSRWSANPDVAADPRTAVKEAVALRNELATKYPNVPWPKMAKLPAEMPSEFKLPAPEGDVGDVAKLSQVARDLTDSLGSVRTKLQAGDFEGAANEMSGLRGKAQSAGINDLVLPDVPTRVTVPQEPPSFELPDTLAELARKKPEQLAAVNDIIASDPNAQLALQKFANELGVKPEDGLAGIHSKLSGYVSSAKFLEDYAEKMAKDASSGGVLALIRRSLKKFVRYGAARAADAALGGGWYGAAGRVIAGEGSNALMGGIEDTLLGGAAVQAKMGVKYQVRQLLSKYAEPAAQKLNDVGPVLAYLGRSFPSGKEDDEKDVRKQAMNRAMEFNHASITAPDSMFVALEGLLGHPSDIAAKLHSHVTNAMKYLAMNAPKDPGTAMRMFESSFLPAWDDVHAFAHRMEAVLNPFSAIVRAMQGDGHPAATEALWTHYPNIMQELGHELAFHLPNLGDMTYEQASGLGTLLNTNLTGLQDPIIAIQIQGLYMPKPEQANQTARVSAKSPGVPGRPAAVQSPVAGTNVSSLIS